MTASVLEETVQGNRILYLISRRQKNMPDYAKLNRRFSFPGPFLPKPDNHKLVVGPGNEQTSLKFQENERKLGKNQLFLSHPRLPFKASQSVSQKKQPHCAKSNRRFSFPGPFLLKPRPSQVSLGSQQLAIVAKDPGKRAQVGQEPTFSKPPPALF